MTGIQRGSGIVMPPIQRGRPNDARLAELDECAAHDVIAEVCASDWAAAKKYLHLYTERQFGPDEADAMHHKIKRIAARIKKKREAISSNSN